MNLFSVFFLEQLKNASLFLFNSPCDPLDGLKKPFRICLLVILWSQAGELAFGDAIILTIFAEIEENFSFMEAQVILSDIGNLLA